MRYSSIFIFVFAVFFSCGRDPLPQKNQQSRPYLPKPIFLDSISLNQEIVKTQQHTIKLPIAKSDPIAQKVYAEILTHPWVMQQVGVTEISQCMLDDIESLKRAYYLRYEQSKMAGIDIPSYEEESREICGQLISLQKSLDTLKLSFPADRYSLINIPDTPQNIYQTPYPFNIYKRIYLGLTALGMPFYLDVRVFEVRKESKLQAMEDIVVWHTKLLEDGERAFKKVSYDDGVVFIGRGKKNLTHFDNSHGFAIGERGIFAAFIPKGEQVYVLYAEAPWNDFDKYQKLLINTLEPQRK